jgi:hypothetical protein
LESLIQTKVQRIKKYKKREIGIEMQTDAIDYNKPSNQEYLTAYNEANDASETGLYFKIELSVRGCIEGESLESTGMYIEY